MKNAILKKTTTILFTGLLFSLIATGQVMAQSTLEYSLLTQEVRAGVKAHHTFQLIQELGSIIISELGRSHNPIPPGNKATVIRNCTELQNIQNNLTGSYILANDIDCSATNPSNPNNASSPWKNTQGFVPMGNNIQLVGSSLQGGFQGTLDGNNYTVYNLFIQRNQDPALSDDVGLFAIILNGTVKNIHLKNILYRLNYDSSNAEALIMVGGLAAGVDNGATISNVSVDGHIYLSGSQNAWVGGVTGASLSGLSNYNLSNVSFTGVIQSPYEGSVLGGITGVFWGGTINQAKVNATLTGSPAVGGIVGSMTVGTVSQSLSHGTILGGELVGGLVGITPDAIVENTAIENSYSTMNVISVSPNDLYRNIGGLVGYGSASLTLQNDYATGLIYASTDKPLFEGGLIGNAAPLPYTTNGSYWNTESTTLETSSGSPNTDGKTTDQLQMKSTFVNWNFNNVWTIVNGQGYPHLEWEKTDNIDDILRELF